LNDRIYNNGVDRLRSKERIERLEVDRVIDLCLGVGEINSVLDVGTGSGLFAEAFSKRNVKTVAGVDVSAEMIEAAKKYLPGAEFKQSGAEDLPFNNNSFDLLFMGLVFHEVDDYNRALTEAWRVAVKAVAILEWQYKVQEFGPPIDHRLTEEFIRKISEETGFKSLEVIYLKQLVLYILIK
jgi:ubiquinone/menaquinone biosynthesis C-methylase UbiE